MDTPFRRSQPRTTRKFLYGIRPVMEAMLEGTEIEAILIQKSSSGPLIVELKELARKREYVVQIVPPEKLDRITRKVHQGVIAFISPVTYHATEELIPSLFEQGISPLLVALDRVTDVRNFGAIARSAVCLGAHGLIVPTKGTAPASEDAVKSSAGALLVIPICRPFDFLGSLLYAKQSGLQLIACSEKGDKDLSSVDLTPPTVLIMGSEDEGIDESIIKRSTLSVRIPITDRLGSLNVSVSAGIILYEAMQQRR